MNIAAILEEHARQFGDRVAIVESHRRISFAELDQRAADAAAYLANAGLAAGMRALVFSPMSIDLYTTMIGMFRLGVTAVFVDPSAGSANLGACIARVRPDAFVAVPRAHWLRLTSAAVRGIRIKATVGPGLSPMRTPWSGRQTLRPEVVRCPADTPAIITFTSGTTGEPKAAVRSHGFLVAQHRALAESLGLRGDDTDLTTLPIFLLANLASGVTSVIPDADLRAPGSIDPAPVLDQIAIERPTRIVASPALLERLVTHAIANHQHLDSFDHVFTGGAPVFPRMLDAIATIAPRAAVVAVYGSTEAEPIASIDRRDISAADRLAMRQGAGLLVGTPEPCIQVRILPDRWGEPIRTLDAGDLEGEALAAGSPGEIVVAGEHVLTSYLDGAGTEETKITIGNRIWHRTGDAGYFDGRGRLWLLGRCSAKVMDEDGVLYPFAVECAASDIPGVVRSALVQRRGRRVLVVEADHARAPDPERVRRRLEWARLADVLIVAHIPVDRRHNAKTDLPALTRMLDAA